jgi:hypothetical protein
VNVAETDSLLASTSAHAGPLHAPPNPVKFEPEAAVAVSVTSVPEVKLAVQVDGQLIPAGLLVTLPLPASVTANCACLGGGGGVLLDPLDPPPPQAVSASSKLDTKNQPDHGRRTRSYSRLRQISCPPE